MTIQYEITMSKPIFEHSVRYEIFQDICDKLFELDRFSFTFYYVMHNSPDRGMIIDVNTFSNKPAITIYVAEAIKILHDGVLHSFEYNDPKLISNVIDCIQEFLTPLSPKGKVSLF